MIGRIMMPRTMESEQDRFGPYGPVACRTAGIHPKLTGANQAGQAPATGLHQVSRDPTGPNTMLGTAARRVDEEPERGRDSFGCVVRQAQREWAVAIGTASNRAITDVRTVP